MLCKRCQLENRKAHHMKLYASLNIVKTQRLLKVQPSNDANLLKISLKVLYSV